jgi:hypothetical protein
MYKLTSVMRFGKHQGSPIQWIIDNDRDYITWAREHIIKFMLNAEAEKYYKDSYRTWQNKKRNEQDRLENFGRQFYDDL